MIGEIENAILARLAAAGQAGVLGYAYRTLETWSAEFVPDLQRQTVQFPGAWASFGGVHRTEQLGGNTFRCHATFAVVVVAKNLRNEQSTRQGGTAAEPGSYQLALDVVGLLQGKSLGLDIDQLVPDSILPIHTEDIPTARTLSVYAVTFSTAFIIEGNVGTDDIADFTDFHVNWDVPPFGGIGPNLPDDAHADATDNVILEGA